VIRSTVDDWHRLLRGELPGGLDALLADDVVFFSPILFSPQRGKALTTMYLNAAFSVLLGGQPGHAGAAPSPTGDVSGSFRYVNEILDGNHAALEFESELDGKYVNGVDLITVNDEGRIVEFKVMIRPLQAVNVLHERMRAMLEAAPGPAGGA
jgi:hypothetical protein